MDMGIAALTTCAHAISRARSAGLLGLFFHLIGDRHGPRETDHEHRHNYWPCHREPIAVRRLSTETKAAFKTTEFVAYVAVLVGLLVARAAVA
jgi:hypothetical protein